MESHVISVSDFEHHISMTSKSSEARGFALPWLRLVALSWWMHHTKCPLESPLLSVINKINSVPGCYWYFSGLSFHNGRKLYEAAFQSSSTARIFKLSTLHHSSSFSCPVQVQCISGVHSMYHSTCHSSHSISFGSRTECASGRCLRSAAVECASTPFDTKDTNSWKPHIGGQTNQKKCLSRTCESIRQQISRP